MPVFGISSRFGLVVLASLVLCVVVSRGPAAAADHKAELTKAAPPEELAPAIAKALAPQAAKVIRGTSRTVCEIWLCKQWTVANLKPKGDVNYPFQPGQLIGAVRFSRKSADFRDQDIGKGVYTLRFGLQPVDGAHVGTSPTRDFLLLIEAEKDKSTQPLKYESLVKGSAETAGSSHPALLSLQRLRGDGKTGSIRHNDEHDWWIVRLQSTAKAGDVAKPVSLDLVVVGQAAE